MEKSPYGNRWVKSKSYIVIENIGTSIKPKYSYSISLEDEKGYCINYVSEDELSNDDVKKNSYNIALNLNDSAVSIIEGLALSNSSEIQTDNDGNLRYYGKTPKNYVTFNNEKAGWRILGVITVDGEKKLKLVRNESIGTFSWDNKNASTGASTAFGSNDWNDARLMKLLNPGYESETQGGSLYWNRIGGNCYYDQGNKTRECDFSGIGLTPEAQSMIVKSTFNVGGTSVVKLTASEMYDTEKVESWEGYVGILSASDYGYASNLSLCTDTLYNYDTDTNCVSMNYLSKSYMEWFLNYNDSTSDMSLRRMVSGYVNHRANTYLAYDVRPVVYLDSSVKFIGVSDGSSESPFVLSK